LHHDLLRNSKKFGWNNRRDGFARGLFVVG
jgi:hypothetical protein